MDSRKTGLRTSVGLIEILGAAWSVAGLFRLLLRTSHVIIPWSFLLIVLGGYSLVGIAGLRLLRNQSGGEVLSAMAQTLQLFQITMGSIAFRFLAGFQLTVFFLGDHISFFAGVTASANLLKGPHDPPLALGVNLVPIALLIVLVRLPDRTLVSSGVR